MKFYLFFGWIFLFFTEISYAIVNEIVGEMCEKQVVVLAELPSHGESLTFQSKAKVIKELVDNCGFNQIHFEAPIYEFLAFKNAIENKQASAKNLDHALGGFWVTKELGKWRSWLFKKTLEGQINLLGLDDQISASSHLTRTQLRQIFDLYLPADIKEHCKATLVRDLFWQYNDTHPYGKKAQQELLSCTMRTYSIIDNNQGPKNTILNILLENLLNLYLRTSDDKSAIGRDQKMYQNFLWHAQKGNNNDKHIIWTATVHAAKKPFSQKFKPLGTYLEQTYGDLLGVVGFTTYSGMTSRAGNKPKPILPAPRDSLEAIILATKNDAIYMNNKVLMKHQMKPSRIHGRFSQHSWHDFYDGIVIFREEKPPTFE